MATTQRETLLSKRERERGMRAIESGEDSGVGKEGRQAKFKWPGTPRAPLTKRTWQPRTRTRHSTRTRRCARASISWPAYKAFSLPLSLARRISPSPSDSSPSIGLSPPSVHTPFARIISTKQKRFVFCERRKWKYRKERWNFNLFIL